MFVLLYYMFDSSKIAGLIRGKRSTAAHHSKIWAISSCWTSRQRLPVFASRPSWSTTIWRNRREPFCQTFWCKPFIGDSKKLYICFRRELQYMCTPNQISKATPRFGSYMRGWNSTKEANTRNLMSPRTARTITGLLYIFLSSLFHLWPIRSDSLNFISSKIQILTFAKSSSADEPSNGPTFYAFIPNIDNSQIPLDISLSHPHICIVLYVSFWCKFYFEKMIFAFLYSIKHHSIVKVKFFHS